MDEQLENLFLKAISAAVDSGAFVVPEDFDMSPMLERPKDKSNGDFACTIAMRLVKVAKKNPREIAQAIVDNFPNNDIVDSIEIAGPGFINVRLSNSYIQNIINVIREQNFDFAKDIAKKYDEASTKKKINLEYISANPTGPMHVGHGRWAALGDSIARILEHAGYNVYQEFYVNDHGVQMHLFANSIYVRYLQQLGQDVEMPDDGYGGDYVVEIAKSIVDEDADKWANTSKEEAVEHCLSVGYSAMMKEIKDTLYDFGNAFDNYFSESSLYVADSTGKNAVDKAYESLDNAGLIYKKDNATWFETTKFGDDKDRVLIKENGDMTYFMSDIAYHYNKLDRGFNHLIDIWGADHHGYIKRCKSMIQAHGEDPNCFEVLLGQLVNLYRNGEAVRMSKRTGQMITFQELLDEVGNDATRYLMLSRSSDQPIDFDIEVAKKQDSSNPVYYVQYAHARICSVLKKAYLGLGANGTSITAFGSGDLPATSADEAKVSIMPMEDISRQLIHNKIDLSLLSHENEIALCKLMATFPEVVLNAAQTRSPHKLVHYSQQLASSFHQFYTNCRVMGVKKDLQQARFALCDSTRICLELTLGLLGVSAPVQM